MVSKLKVYCRKKKIRLLGELELESSVKCSTKFPTAGRRHRRLSSSQGSHHSHDHSQQYVNDDPHALLRLNQPDRLSGKSTRLQRSLDYKVRIPRAASIVARLARSTKVPNSASRSKMADLYRQRERILKGLRGLPPQAKGIAQSLASRTGLKERQGLTVLPSKTALILYPTYSFVAGLKFSTASAENYAGSSSSVLNDCYTVVIRGWLYREGDLNSRRSKIIVSAANKLVGKQQAVGVAGQAQSDTESLASQDPDAAAEQLIEILSPENDIDSDTISTSSGSERSVSSSTDAFSQVYNNPAQINSSAETRSRYDAAPAFGRRVLAQPSSAGRPDLQGGPGTRSGRSNSNSSSSSSSSSSSGDEWSRNSERTSNRNNRTDAEAFPGRDNVVTRRLASLLQRGIPNQTINLRVEPNDKAKANGASCRELTIETDSNGRFEHTLRVPWSPQCVDAWFARDQGGPTAFVCPQAIDASHVSIISDVDDTIRVTGVNKGRFETLRNILARGLNDVYIPGMSEWYRKLADAGSVFHYVSNSPWQLFDLINAYITHHRFPQGSIHLKYYQGLIDGLFEPVVTRKKSSLTKLLTDIPGRKFILIGDSGELDLEAYVDIARSYPDQILAIYIRDITTPESESLDQLTSLISPTPATTSDADLIQLGDSDSPPTPKASGTRKYECIPEFIQHQKAMLTSQSENAPGGVGGSILGASHVSTTLLSAAGEAIRGARNKYRSEPKTEPRTLFTPNHLSSDKQVHPPPIPPRPKNLALDRSAAPSLPPRRVPVPSEPPKLPPRRPAEPERPKRVSPPATASRRASPPSFISSSQDYSEYEKVDKQYAAWKTRVALARRDLPEHIELKLWRVPGDVERHSLELVNGPTQPLNLL